MIADSIADAREQLQALADGGQISTGRTVATAPKLAFVCTGMGPQWWKMCRGLLDVFPAFTDSIQRSDRELSRYTDWSLVDELRRDESCSRMAETEIAQPANFAIQVALAEQLAQFGIRPDAVIGHSAGEVAAHHLAGLLTFEQAIEVIYHRSRLQQRTSGQGRMLAVGLDAETLMRTIDGKALDEFGRRVSVAAINSPSAVTVAGDSDLLDDIARQLDEAGIFNRHLSVKVPYHTHYMEAVKDDLFSALEGLSSKAATLPLYSTVTGEQLEGYQAGAAYWWQNTRATVLFEPAIRRMLEDGYTHFVELGPHPVLAASIFETAGKQRVSVMATQRRDHDDSRTLLNCVGALHCNGHEVAWNMVQPRRGGRLLKLPSYPWQTKRFWNETQEAVESLFYDPVHPLLGQSVSALHPTWEAELSTVLQRIPRRSPGAGKRRRARGGVRRNGSGSGQRDLRVEPQRGQPRAAPRRHTRRDLRPHSQDHPQRGRRHAGVRCVHGHGRRGFQMDDHRDRGAQHPSDGAAPSRPAGRRRAGHLDRR